MTPAKLLLFGEHTVLHGGEALAVPLQKFGAAWAAASEAQPRNLLFSDWVTYASNGPHEPAGPAGRAREWLDVDRWRSEVPDLAVASDIPKSYGLGSSGALTAMIYERYASADRSAVALSLLRARLAWLEGYFHGRSSGLDPLVCYLRQAVRIHVDASISRVEAFDLPIADAGEWFLLNSRQPKAGKAAIARFGESCKEDGFRQNYLAPARELTAELIAMALGELAAAVRPFSGRVKRLSTLQLEHLDWLIPTHIRTTWQTWLERDLAYLKLCGAGGGGFFLGLAIDPHTLRHSSQAQSIVWL